MKTLQEYHESIARHQTMTKVINAFTEVLQNEDSRLFVEGQLYLKASDVLDAIAAVRQEVDEL